MTLAKLLLIIICAYAVIILLMSIITLNSSPDRFVQMETSGKTKSTNEKIHVLEKIYAPDDTIVLEKIQLLLPKLDNFSSQFEMIEDR